MILAAASPFAFAEDQLLFLIWDGRPPVPDQDAVLQQLPLLTAPLCLLCALVAAEWLGRRLGGMTGDVYGAVVMLSETSSLLLIALMLSSLGSGAG